MEFRSVDRRQTFFHSPFIEDYYYTSKFDNLRSYKPEISEVGRAIEAKTSFGIKQRELLVSDLRRQYKEADISLADYTKLETNIALLKEKNTFTVTTGQQIHIGLGPLYVLYKIFDTIAIAHKVKSKHPTYNIIPVFWMASEDHDLEEIQDIPLYGKTFRWETEQKGPVGRMNPQGIAELFESIEKSFNLSEEQLEFISECRNVYSNSATLSIAFRRLLNHYFGKEGLVIIDGDSRVLKASFSEVLEDELLHANFNALEESTSAIESLGYKRQLVIRKCNLFKMSKLDRRKITSLESLTNLKGKELSVFVNANSFEISPNAALRPLYQEWVLPNLVYVGGGSEVKYWMQLKGVFDNYKLPMPLVHLRTSCIALSKKQEKILEPIKLENIFKEDSFLIKNEDKSAEDLNDQLNSDYLQVYKSINTYSDLVSRSFSGFSLATKLSKIYPKLQELKELVDAQMVKKSKENPKLKSILKVKNDSFNIENIQERKMHVIGDTAVLKLASSDILIEFGFSEKPKILIISKP